MTPDEMADLERDSGFSSAEQQGETLRAAILAELARYHPQSRGPTARDIAAAVNPGMTALEMYGQLVEMSRAGLVDRHKVRGAWRWRTGWKQTR